MTELKQVLSLKQTLQLVMTPQLQQAIKLLQLSRLELAETINTEMLENPLLEEEPEQEAVDEKNLPAEERLRLAAERIRERIERTEKLESMGEADPEQVDVERLLEEYSSYSPTVINREQPAEDMPSYEAVVSKEQNLTDHLLWQLRLSSLNEQQLRIATQIILNLNEDGYLVADDEDRLAGKDIIEAIADSLQVSRAEVEQVLQAVQEFDPPGVAARNLRESLLIQAKRLKIENGLVYAIIDSYLPLVERKNLQQIARELKVELPEVSQAVQIISGLEPRPGRAFSDERPQYITPDIYVYRLGDEYVIVLNEDGLPKLRISPYYRSTLAAGGTGSEAHNYIQDKLRSAIWLIRSIHQRQRTIYRVTESIVRFQREFLEKGIAYLKPLVLREVAEDIGLHESTVSRVTTNKFVHTPQGIFELKFFFNAGLTRKDGQDVATEAVKEQIRQLVAQEDPARPLSDKEIVERLGRQGINLARRTVAKYRDQLGILPAAKRKKLS